MYASRLSAEKRHPATTAGGGPEVWWCALHSPPGKCTRRLPPAAGRRFGGVPYIVRREKAPGDYRRRRAGGLVVCLTLSAGKRHPATTAYGVTIHNFAVRTKKHRLPEAAYVGKRTVSFTLCVAERRPVLADTTIVESLVTMLETASKENECIVPLYCFMPDHAHIVISGELERSRPKRAMDQFKHRAGMWLAGSRPQIKWQHDYYDQIVSRSSDWSGHLRYIALNPVRAGLASSILDWPFTGSIGFDLNEIFLDAFW